MKKILLLLTFIVVFQSYGQTINSWIRTPNGGEVYQPGDVMPLRLNVVPTSGPTYAWLLKSGSIVAHLPTFIGYNLNWTVPNSIPPGNDYKIRVADINNIYAWDESDHEFVIGPFEVTQPACSTQVSPNHTIPQYRMIDVAWTGSGTGTVTIELYHNQSKVATLAPLAPNSGQFSIDSSLITIGSSNSPGDMWDYSVKVIINDTGQYAFSCKFGIIYI